MSRAAPARLAAAVFDSDLIATRCILAIAEALWAALLWWPGELFDRPAYAGLAVVAHENVWGLVYALSAVTQLHIVALGHYSRPYARLFAAWNAVLWCYCAAAILAAQYPPSAISGEIALALAACWIWLRPIVLCLLSDRAWREVQRG